MKTTISICLLLCLATMGCNRGPQLTPAQELRVALKKKDPAAVQAALAKKPALNEADTTEEPPLTTAVKTGDVELVQLLIDQGADANHPGVNYAGGSPGKQDIPLMVAARQLDVEMVRLLLANGANADVRTMTSSGVSSPLKEALKMSSDATVPEATVKIIRLLVEHGAKPMEHPQDDAFQPAVHWAAARGELELLKWLSTQGFDVRLPRINRTTTLHDAAFGGSDEAVRWLLTQMVEVDARNELENWTPLHLAALGGHASTVKILLEEAGCNVNGGESSPAIRGGTPLHVAVHKNHLEVAKILIDAGADLSLRDERKLTPLGFALGIVQNPQAFGAGPGAPPPDLNAMLKLLRAHNAPE